MYVPLCEHTHLWEISEEGILFLKSVTANDKVSSIFSPLCCLKLGFVDQQDRHYSLLFTFLLRPQVKSVRSDLADNSVFFLFITSHEREPFWPVKPVNSLMHINQLNIIASCYLWGTCTLNNVGNAHDYPRDFLSLMSLLIKKWTIK